MNKMVVLNWWNPKKQQYMTVTNSCEGEVILWFVDMLWSISLQIDAKAFFPRPRPKCPGNVFLVGHVKVKCPH